MNVMLRRAAFSGKAIWLFALVVTAGIAIAGHTRANDKESEPNDEKFKDLPSAVVNTAQRYAPDLKIEDVKTREIEGHPRVFVIDGESEDRDVVLHITEEGAILEARFHDRPEGVKPVKRSHSTEELPTPVRETAMRVFPEMEVVEIQSHQAAHEAKVFHITGRAVEDGKEREVVLVIEADGDLLEARCFKPRIVSAADFDDESRERTNRNDKDGFND